MTRRLPVCLAWMLLCLPVAAESAEATRPTAMDKPLVASWNFDEPSGAEFLDGSGNGNHASPEAGRQADVRRMPGLFGSGLQLGGHHKVQCPQRPAFESVERIGFSAWVLPTDLAVYKEIFRKEDGNDRVLFSFQHDGTILSLGLNIGGYIECDATIKPAEVLDGGWHHCAATFDGRTMRVYLDGTEVGSLERPGKIHAGGPAPGCIGSSNGGENFQGMIDDLRIYAEPLTPQEIATLYREGVEVLTERNRDLAEQLREFYVDRGSFAETLAACRKNVLDKKITLHSQLASVVLARLKATYADDYRRFVEYTGATPAEYLYAGDNQFNVQTAERLVGMLLEYKPLTESQCARQTEDERARWEQLDVYRLRLEELKAQGDAATASPAWIELMLETGPQIQYRPMVAEAVAPYVPPSTPKTRDLTADEARDALRRDWLHQAGGNPSAERIRSEIAWTRELAERIAGNYPGQVDFSTQLARLERIEQQAAALTAPDAELYFAVREIKRAIQLANPVIDFDRVLFVDMPFPQGKEWPHETRHRLGYQAVPGARLLVLSGLAPDGRLQPLMPQPPLHGSFWRPDVSFDARRALFCFKPHNEKSFHLYEINIDGSGLVQLTDGPYDDLDPIYLPDGHIIFSTTRGHTYVRCMPPTNAYVLARCDRDGRNVYLISRNNEPDYLPSVMNDGRVIYTRWEYTDKPLWRAQSLWTVNPDGTQVSTFWGNQSVWPDLLKDARSIPGSSRVMFTGSAHHNWFSGSVGIIDPDKGFNFPDGLTKVTADVTWPESGNGPVDPIESPRYHASGSYAAYYSPYPLGEQDFLVSANRGGKFVLYLMDVDGNRELIYEGVHNIFHALPVRPRPVPPVLADRVLWPSLEQRNQPQGGVIYSSNVYQGAPAVLKDRARYLRILNIEPKTYTYWHKRPYISTGPVVSIVQSEGVKRLIGTVPIEADGSVSFQAPSGVALHFQLLDENYRALQTMRSFTGVMPGERRGCLGCHESHSRTPVGERSSLAWSREPSRITPPPWDDDTVSYGRYVQPVLDEYCGKCHQGDGEAVKDLDLTRRPGFLMFDEPYVTLTGRPTWGQAYQMPADAPPGWGIANTLMVEAYEKTDPRAYQTPEPMTALSYRSRLIELCSNGQHYDVRVDPISLRRLIVWVDTMCPYRGAEEVREIPDPEFQGVDWLAIRPRIQTAPRIIRPGPVD